MNAAVALIISGLFGLCTISNGALFVPNAYTLEGVVAVNGSNANGSCPSECVGMASVRRCDCDRTGLTVSGITGVLIDNTVPTLNPVGNMWASQLLTVMGGGNSIMVGVRLDATSSGATLPALEVVIYVFRCPAWGIGAERITVRYSGSFPNFVGAFNSPGSVNLMNIENCDSLTRVSIPLQPISAVVTNYFLVFHNPSGAVIQWVHIGEVMFSNQPIPVPTTSSTTMATTTTQEQTTATTPAETTVNEVATTQSSSTSDLTTEVASSTSPITTTPITATTENDKQSTPTPPSTSSDMTEQTTTGDTPSPENQSSFPGAIVGGLVGVIIALLVLLLIGGFIIACFMRNRRKSYRTEVEQLQGVVMERNSANFDSTLKVDSIGTTTADNYHYQKTEFDVKPRSQSSPAVVPKNVTIVNNGIYYSKLDESAVRSTSPPQVNEANYTTIPVKTSEGQADMYDEIKTADPEAPDDSQYSTIDSCIKEKEQAVARQQETSSNASSPSPGTAIRHKPYSLVQKKDPPIVPPKTPELYRDLAVESGRLPPPGPEDHYTEVDGDLKRSPSYEAWNPVYASADRPGLDTPAPLPEDTTTTPPTFLGEYSEIEKDEDLQDDVYTEVNDKENMVKKKVTNSGPVVLSNAVCDDMEENPEYESTDAARVLAKVAQPDSIVYSNPDTLDGESESIYNTVYSEPIVPSMFAKATAQLATTPKEEEGGTPATMEPSEAAELEDIYSPIYNLSSSMNSSDPKQTLLSLQPENIKKIKTLGTGFFGKVILANTVGLSLKDLRMSETDDDKTKSIQVAVKKLRLNPSAARIEAFDKELRFMSRLNHPNVVRALGACTTDSPYIMMEYMAIGDLNQYLQDFDNIVPGNAPPTTIEISVGTLTYMCSQIACAMNYLASKNFIHRDLATRNCLVGENSTIKIADFGMSRSLYESHYYVIKGHAVLPVRWMARECFYGKFSAKTDVWAFGVTMWEMFTLAKDIPYEDMDDTEVVNDATKPKEDRKLLERPKDCPQDVYSVMLMCWAMEPSDRATFDTLHESLTALVQ